MNGPSPPPLEVVVVTYRSAQFIRDCLNSVVRFAPPDAVIHVVDNGSPDDTVAIIQREFPTVRLTIRNDNPGFGVANNLVLRDIKAPHVLVLNPDAAIERGIVEHLIASMAASPEIGILGCRLVRADGTFDHAAKRFIPSPVEAASYFLGRLFGYRGTRYTAPGVNEFGVGEVDAVNGAFMFIRTKALNEVGLFDEDYWMYGEDLDLCTRFRAANWRVVYDGRVTAHHLKGASVGVRSWKLNYEFHRSMVIYWRKHGTSTTPLRQFVELGIWVKFIVTAMVDGSRRLIPRQQ